MHQHDVPFVIQTTRRSGFMFLLTFPGLLAPCREERAVLSESSFLSGQNFGLQKTTVVTQTSV